MRARWLRDPRSWGLQFCAGVCLSRALAYIPSTREDLPIGLADVAQVVPVWVYGILWGATAVALMVTAIRGARPMPMRTVALVAVPALWGSLYLAGALTDQSARAAASGYLFLCMAGIITCFLLEPRRESTWVIR